MTTVTVLEDHAARHRERAVKARDVVALDAPRRARQPQALAKLLDGALQVPELDADVPQGLPGLHRHRLEPDGQVRSLDQAKRNANDGISLVQTAEGALNEVSSIMVRLRELAVQAANGTLTTGDRATIDAEFQELIAEIDRISNTAEFNGLSLLDGSAGILDIQVGIGSAVADNAVSMCRDYVAETYGADALRWTEGRWEGIVGQPPRPERPERSPGIGDRSTDF